MGNVIVVGVDDSETAARAAQAAADLASHLGASLHVVTAYDRDESSVVTVGSDRYDLTSVDEALAIARSVADTLEHDGLEVTTSAALGRPHDVLIAAAERLDASVIVVGNRRMQGPGRILGSVASAVAHHAPCDVYIVKTT